MSRHRNVRNMIAEEDYDYYDYDYDDDEYYDEYDKEYGGAAPLPAKKKKNKKKKATAVAAMTTATTATSNSHTNTSSANTNTNTTTTITTKQATAGSGATGLTVVPPPASSSSVKLATPSRSSSSNNNNNNNTTTTATTTPLPPPPIPVILLQKRAKPTLTLVILGHVDAGKSTLTGQLLWSSRTTNKTTTTSRQQQQQQQRHNNNNNNNNNNNLAWLLDEDEQERRHGITMQVATKVLVTPKYEIILQDAPGHADYVPSMIGGTAAADAALVVVDASSFTCLSTTSTTTTTTHEEEEEEEETALGTLFRTGCGQLREHLNLAKGLGIPQLIVAMNKMDVPKWNVQVYRTMKKELQHFLSTELGYHVATKVQFVPVSALTGINVVQAPRPENVPELTRWYQGPTLWQTLDLLDPPPVGRKLLEKPLRMIVSDVSGQVGKGIAVRAKVVAGWIGVGQALVVSPVQDETNIYKMTRIQLVEGRAVDSNNNNNNNSNNNSNNKANQDDPERESYAVAGELWDLVLTGLDISRISTGNILARPGALPPLTTKCRAKIFVLDGVTVPIIRGAQAILHMHFLDVPCHLSALHRTLKPPQGTQVLKERPRVLTAKVQAVVEITLHYAIAMEAFSDCRALGRFVLRRSGASIAVGRVEQVLS